MAFDPGLRPVCVLTAADALGGSRHGTEGDYLFGNSWLSWHWRDIAGGVLVSLLGVGAAWIALRRRRLNAR